MQKRQLLFIGAAVALPFTAAACVQQSRVDDPALCGQVLDGTAVVMLPADSGNCTRLPGQKAIIVAEKCGPLMGGSNVADDCYRGSIPGRPSPDNFRYGTIIAAGGQVINFVASDATAS